VQNTDTNNPLPFWTLPLYVLMSTPPQMARRQPAARQNVSALGGPKGLQIQTAMCRDVVHVTPCVDNSAFLNSYSSNCYRTPHHHNLGINNLETQNIVQIQFQPHELNDLHSSRSNFRVIESRRIRCSGHGGEVHTGFWLGNLWERNIWKAKA
jgi:hypothetical protein